MALVLILGLGASQAWAWGSTTHTYINDRLNREGPDPAPESVPV